MNKKGIIGIIIVILVVLIATGIYLLNNNNKNNNSNSIEDANLSAKNEKNALQSSNVDSGDNSNNNETNEEYNSSSKNSTGLQVGSYTLNYGKYFGDDYSEGTDRAPNKGTYAINEDGTYSYSISTGYSEMGTYKVVSLSSMGPYYSEKYGIEFSNGVRLGVFDNNIMESLAGAGNQYVYQGK